MLSNDLCSLLKQNDAFHMSFLYSEGQPYKVYLHRCYNHHRLVSVPYFVLPNYLALKIHAMLLYHNYTKTGKTTSRLAKGPCYWAALQRSPSRILTRTLLQVCSRLRGNSTLSWGAISRPKTAALSLRQKNFYDTETSWQLSVKYTCYNLLQIFLE